MLEANIPELIKQLRSRPLYDGPVAEQQSFPHPSALIPHRPPFLLVDEIIGLQEQHCCARALMRVTEDDPVFAGHFPGRPIYPGVLLLEAAGQVAACAAALLSDRAERNTDAQLTMFATRIHHALFVNPVLPGYELDIHVKLIDRSLIYTFAAQVWARGSLCALTVGDFYVADK